MTKHTITYFILLLLLLLFYIIIIIIIIILYYYYFILLLLLADQAKDEVSNKPEYSSLLKLDGVDVSSDSENSTNFKLIIDNPWTKEEDKILLENVRKDYSEETFSTISLLLRDRSVSQVIF